LLSSEERAWVSLNDSIVIVPYKTYSPIDFIDVDGKQKGIT
jgi:hypothetical protein